MNYKLIHKPGQWSPIPNTDGKYVTQDYDILETRTNQIVAENVPGFNDQAKALCRHLNLGGGFDGHTPEFFLQRLSLSEDNG